MHSAPSVSYPVGRSRDATRLLVVIWAAGACCAGAASYQFDSVGWRQWLLLLSVALAALAVLNMRVRASSGTLDFDGQHWSLSGKAAFPIVETTVVLDFQSLLLLRLRGVRSARWRWIERRAEPSRWHDLRRAVYSRTPSAERADPLVAP